LPQTIYAAGSIFSQAEGGLKDAINQGYTGGTGDVVLGPTSFLDGALNIVNYLLSFLGIIFFLLLIYSGFLWMTAEGNDEKLNKAKKITREVVIGLVIIITARIITEFVLSQVGNIIKSS